MEGGGEIEREEKKGKKLLEKKNSNLFIQLRAQSGLSLLLPTAFTRMKSWCTGVLALHYVFSKLWGDVRFGIQKQKTFRRPYALKSYIMCQRTLRVDETVVDSLLCILEQFHLDKCLNHNSTQTQQAFHLQSSKIIYLLFLHMGYFHLLRVTSDDILGFFIASYSAI